MNLFYLILFVYAVSMFDEFDYEGGQDEISFDFVADIFQSLILKSIDIADA